MNKTFFFALLALICAENSFSEECGEETIDAVYVHGTNINSGNSVMVATKGTAVQEQPQLCMRNVPNGETQFQVRWSAAPGTGARAPRTVGTYFANGSNGVGLELTSSNTGRTDYRQLGFLIKPMETVITRVANAGFAASPGDSFKATASVGANTFTTVEVDATNVAYQTIYNSCYWNGANFVTSVSPNRAPDCSLGNPCYEKRIASYSTTDPTETCAYINGWSGGDTVVNALTSESANTENFDSPSSGRYTVICKRIQDTCSFVGTPGLRSRWVRFVLTESDHSCSYGYEDTVTRCTKRTNK
jgi:hypothetical protein